MGSIRQPSGYTIEIDTGGTFTDGYVTGEGGVVVTAKSDTTPFDLTTGVLACIDEAAKKLGFTRTDLLRRAASIRVSTTVGTNTLINRNGPEIGLLLGERSSAVVSELSESLPISHRLIATIGESDNESDLTVDETAVQEAVRGLLDTGARVLVVALTAGPDLAQREASVREVIGRSYPRHYLGAVPVVPSNQISLVEDPRIRVQTAVLSAYLHPVMSSFLYRLEDNLRTDGYTQPMLVANADGGTSRVAKTTALRTWGSGPAGGVAATATMAEALELSTAVGYDVGGTSTDVCVILDHQWAAQVQPSIEGIDVSLPSLSLVSAPIGGGSLARVEQGEVLVGPKSAGAQPGPACFGLGGTGATVTDAASHLGFVDPASFLGGRKQLDRAAAERVIETIGTELGISSDEAAWRIIDRACQNIAAAIGEQTSALEADDIALFATGGAGSMLAGFVHETFDAPVSYAFPTSPVFSAFGLARLDVRHAYEIASNSEAFETDLEAALERAVSDMVSEGFTRDSLSFSVETELVASDGTVQVVNGIVREATDAGRPRLSRLKVAASRAPGDLPSAGTGAAAAVGQRRVTWPDGATDTPVYNWPDLPEGSTVPGPAIVETSETTLVVPPAMQVQIGRYGEARMTKR